MRVEVPKGDVGRLADDAGNRPRPMENRTRFRERDADPGNLDRRNIATLDTRSGAGRDRRYVEGPDGYVQRRSGCRRRRLVAHADTHQLKQEHWLIAVALTMRCR